VATSIRLAREALAIDSGDAAAIAMAGLVLAITGHDYDAGCIAAQRALDINPNSASVCWVAGWVISFSGDPARALPDFEQSLRLRPSDPQANFLLNGMGMCHLLLGNREGALECATQSGALYGELDVTYYIFIPACGYLGRKEDGARGVAKLPSLTPGLTIFDFARRMPFRDPAHLAILTYGLRKAGMPE